MAKRAKKETIATFEKRGFFLNQPTQIVNGQVYITLDQFKELLVLVLLRYGKLKG